MGYPTPFETSSSTVHGAGALCSPGVLDEFSKGVRYPHLAISMSLIMCIIKLLCQCFWRVLDLSETDLNLAVEGTFGSPVSGLAETAGRNGWMSPVPLFRPVLDWRSVLAGILVSHSPI